MVIQLGRTEMILNCLNPKFAKKFVLDYYFETVQRLKFSVYDIDCDSSDLDKHDFLGESECTLGQVSVTLHIYTTGKTLINNLSLRCTFICAQIVSNKQLTRALLLRDDRPAGRGTITVRARKTRCVRRCLELFETLTSVVCTKHGLQAVLLLCSVYVVRLF